MKNFKFNPKLKAILISIGVSVVLVGCGTEDVGLSKETVDVTTEDNSIDSYEDFSSEVNDVENLILEDKLEKAKDKAQDLFITGVDFIFYDEPINGVYFESLTNEGKELVTDSLAHLGNMTDEVCPGWRGELSSQYQVISQGIVESVQDYLGEENYEAIGNIKDKLVDDFVDTKDKVKSKVKTWYEEFRSSKE